VKGEKPIHPTPDVLVDYAEGTLHDARWKEHINHCEVCSSEVSRLKETIALAKEIGDPEPAEAYWRSFDFRLDQGIRKGERRNRPRRWSFVAAAALLALGVWVVQNRLSMTRSTSDAAVAVLPPVETDVEFQFLSSFAETIESEEGWEDVLDYGWDTDLDPAQLTAEEQRELEQMLERELEGGNHAIS
jgi:hypothetical protein